MIEHLNAMQNQMRDELNRLKNKMTRLQKFVDSGFSVEKCPEEEHYHYWLPVDFEHDYNNYNSVLMECEKCGTREWWEYKFEKADEEDPWADLRPEAPKEEEE